MLTVQIRCFSPRERKLVKKHWGLWKAIKCCWRRACNGLTVCLLQCFCHCLPVSLALCVFLSLGLSLSACEVKVASMVTAHSVYATTSHFITSCWWLSFACMPVSVCVCVCWSPPSISAKYFVHTQTHTHVIQVFVWLIQQVKNCNQKTGCITLLRKINIIYVEKLCFFFDAFIV